ncbi:unnamed protein product [Coregonus sp. 'balchen']|nr:unnamed protein product [Coregonus sp. 'balchen']
MPGAQFKAVYVPSFGSQSSRCSQKDGQQTKKYLIELSCSQRRHDALSTKNKIKLTKCKPALFKKKRKEERRSMPPRRPMIDRLTAVRSQGGGERSQHQKRGSPDQWAARQAVLRTIGRMLQENRSIRERLVSLSQSSQVIN